MEKNELLGISVAVIVAGMMLWITRWSAYIDAMDNWFFLFLIVFLFAAIGFGISKLFPDGKKKGGGKKSEKDAFILDD